MKNFLIIIFTTITLLSPALSANALDLGLGLEILNITTTTIDIKASGLEKSTQYNIKLDNIDDILIYKRVMSDFNGNAVFNFSGLSPNSTYIAELREGISFTGKVLMGLNIHTKSIFMKINSFSPLTGKEGDIVTITGENFSGIDKIFFGDIESTIDNVNSTTIKTKVPVGAKTAKITIKTVKDNIPENFLSLNDFIVIKAPSKITVNTYDLKSTSTSLEFHNLPVGEKFTAFVKADSDNGNTTGFYAISDLPLTTKIGNTVYVDNFNSLTPGSAYVGGIVGDISVHFITPLTDIVLVDYSILEKTIALATELVTGTKEGTDVGQYPIGSTEILNTVLRKTKKDLEFIKNNSETETIEVMQSRVNSNIAELQMAIDIFKAKIIGDSGSTPNTKTSLSSKSEGLIPECPIDGCGFNELMKLINNSIKFLLFTIATPLAALGIVYAGWLYLSAGGNTENTTKAKKILTNIVVGYIIALAAWLIVNTILKSLGLDPSINTFLK